jgi:MFS family permease
MFTAGLVDSSMHTAISIPPFPPPLPSLSNTYSSCTGQIPHALIIQKVPPRFWLPFTFLVWSVLTMCNAACATYSQLCVVRFLQGFFEASLYSGTIYILSSWYKPCEIAKRTAIFTAVGQVGSMFAGIMMTAMNEGLKNRMALEGWQWLFIISTRMPSILCSLETQCGSVKLTTCRWRNRYPLCHLRPRLLPQSS